ncbi:hypothetical protein HJG60_010732 [Phyllostomus discolor]|uniref:Uncharacterized protein n=1 Tax=Phyllostomus discolor TaxID=89673 RepID=A0A834EF41_9CHIR|nr:hypothetical protein HJG60_010732 [Phyllostomus discolor]
MWAGRYALQHVAGKSGDAPLFLVEAAAAVGLRPGASGRWLPGGSEVLVEGGALPPVLSSQLTCSGACEGWAPALLLTQALGPGRSWLWPKPGAGPAAWRVLRGMRPAGGPGACSPDRGCTPVCGREPLPAPCPGHPHRPAQGPAEPGEEEAHGLPASPPHLGPPQRPPTPDTEG